VSLFVFLLLSLVMAVSIGFLTSWSVSTWLKKSTQAQSSAQPLPVSQAVKAHGTPSFEDEGAL